LQFFELFRRRPPIRAPEALADFVDQHSAFLVQKGIYEYSRARAGHYAKVLFREQGFHDAVEQSRWRAYPLGLAMVAELVEGVLRPYAADRHRQLETLKNLVLSVFDRYPVPSALSAQEWREARLELVRRLHLISMHAPKRAFDICEPFTETYFNLMPIHEKLRAPDYLAISNYLRVSLINVHDQLIARLDRPAVVQSLLAEQTQ
jgi:hypothetical protein